MCIIFQVQTHVNAFILQLETCSLSKQNAVCTRLDFNLDVDGTVHSVTVLYSNSHYTVVASILFASAASCKAICGVASVRTSDYSQPFWLK